MNKALYYGSITAFCFLHMGFTSYRRVGFDNFTQFITNMFSVESTIAMAILGGLQVKCIDAIYTKYLE